MYTIGIGSGCSKELITESAKAGKGKFEFISDNEDMTEKIISLLRSSLSPCLDNFELNYDKDLVEMNENYNIDGYANEQNLWLPYIFSSSFIIYFNFTKGIYRFT